MSNDSFKINPGSTSLITINTELQMPITGTFLIAQPKQYNLTPQDDATPVEAMYVSYYFAWFQSPGFSPSEMFPHWQLIKRHFTEVK
jgi:hypothetical protein